MDGERGGLDNCAEMNGKREEELLILLCFTQFVYESIGGGHLTISHFPPTDTVIPLPISATTTNSNRLPPLALPEMPLSIIRGQSPSPTTSIVG